MIILKPKDMAVINYCMALTLLAMQGDEDAFNDTLEEVQKEYTYQEFHEITTSIHKQFADDKISVLLPSMLPTIVS